MHLFFSQLDPKCEPNCALNNYKDIEKKSRMIFGIECMEELKNAPATSKKIVKTRVDPPGCGSRVRALYSCPNCILRWNSFENSRWLEISVMIIMMIVLLCTFFDVRFIYGGRVDLKILPIGRQREAASRPGDRLRSPRLNQTPHKCRHA